MRPQAGLRSYIRRSARRIGSGGLWGEGYGLSTQKLQYLPIQSTDFIFAVFAEEFGYVGSVVLLLFLLIAPTLAGRLGPTGVAAAKLLAGLAYIAFAFAAARGRR